MTLSNKKFLLSQEKIQVCWTPETISFIPRTSITKKSNIKPHKIYAISNPFLCPNTISSSSSIKKIITRENRRVSASPFWIHPKAIVQSSLQSKKQQHKIGKYTGGFGDGFEEECRPTSQRNSSCPRSNLVLWSNTQQALFTSLNSLFRGTKLWVS